MVGLSRTHSWRTNVETMRQQTELDMEKNGIV